MFLKLLWTINLERFFIIFDFINIWNFGILLLLGLHFVSPEKHISILCRHLIFPVISKGIRFVYIHFKIFKFTQFKSLWVDFYLGWLFLNLKRIFCILSTWKHKWILIDLAIETHRWCICVIFQGKYILLNIDRWKGLYIFLFLLSILRTCFCMLYILIWCHLIIFQFTFW